MIGTQVKDYRIIQEIGKGGMATVFLVEHIMLHNQAALKLLNQEYVRNEHIRKRFLAEARSMARMSHTGVVKVNDLIEENDTVAFVMEYIEGETLKEYLDRKGKLKDDEIKTIFSQMLEAVGYVHKQNLVHRDIKPSNFMIDREGNVKLMDFGIAKTLDASAAEYDQTTAEMRLGTPRYMSPEQINETRSVTAQSDLYSLGVVLWQMVTRKRPYETQALSTFQLKSKIVNAPLEDTNTQWDILIKKATAKDAAKRFFSCNSMVEALRNIRFRGDSDATIIDTGQEIPMEKTDDYGIEFIWVEGGKFMMGPDEDSNIRQEVILGGYFMSKYPVTQAQWVRAMGRNPSEYSSNGSNCPVESVSWMDCQNFIQKINKELNANYRLPTEAEWEYAARGGIKSMGYKYSGSDNMDDVAWYAGNRSIEIEKKAFFGSSKKMEIQYLGTHPVGKKKPNELGIYDMSGNVWEWCSDRYGAYSSASVNNPRGPSAGSNRVMRGGSWYDYAQYCRSAYRSYSTPDNRYINIGFRLVSPE